MAESGGVSRILGTDSESPAEGSAPKTPTRLDPTAAELAQEHLPTFANRAIWLNVDAGIKGERAA